MRNGPIRVLQVMATLDRGGAETVVIDWLRHIDRNQTIFDFIVNDGEGPYAFEEEALRLGAVVVRAPRFKLWNLIHYSGWWYRCLRAHPEWGLVHAHHTVPAFVYVLVARLLGRTTIAHSHTGGHPGKVGRWARSGLTWPLRRVAHIRLACSRVAALWMFGSRSGAQLVPNGVELDRFRYSPEERSRIREELGLDGEFVVGHVGRFAEPKNHSRVLRIFASLLLLEPQARLLLVGDGKLRSSILHDIRSLELDEHVILVGSRADVPALLCAMDVLLFPSFYEGLPVTIVEAQASGLPCVVADSVTDEVGLTDLVRFISLATHDNVWVDALLETRRSARRSRVDELRVVGYDSTQVAQEMMQLYLELLDAQSVKVRR